MKKTIIFTILILLLSTLVMAGIDSETTSGLLNGRFVLSNTWTKREVGFYIGGVVDTLWQVRPDIMQTHYTTASVRGDIADAVIKYYRDNPTQRYRSIIDVIISGCK